MFCYQCQETARNIACTTRGVCGKTSSTAALQDCIVYVCKGIGALASHKTAPVSVEGRRVFRALFSTITNANFDEERLLLTLRELVSLRNSMRKELGIEGKHDAVRWEPGAGSLPEVIPSIEEKSLHIGVASIADENERSLKELITYGIKGICAYGEHAAVLGFEDEGLYREVLTLLMRVLTTGDVPTLVGLALECGNIAVRAMALLDKANTSTWGNPEITTVNIGAGNRPGILISGHDLADMAMLLEQTLNTGIDVYTHSEMLAANYYPAFKKYPHFHGNYGNAWWQQDKEFESFRGAILMTTNCIVPVRPGYASRIWTTGEAGYPGVPHIEADSAGNKDFSALIGAAQGLAPPLSLEEGSIVGGFAHAQIKLLADKVTGAIKTGALKRFVVMAGCDGRQGSRAYFSELASGLPGDTVILTAGCAKYRYNKLKLGDIGGIPRVLDAGQCNDSYSLAVTALTLKEVLGAADVNDLPIDFAIAWYEQKAVAVLLALLALGFKNIRLGPTVPAFLSPTVLGVLVEKFGIRGTATAAEDLAAITA